MALNQQQITGLDAASARKAAGTANAADLKNLSYAAGQGYVYKPQATQQATPVAINGAQYNTKALQQQNFSNIAPSADDKTLMGIPKVPATVSSQQLTQDNSGALAQAKAQNQSQAAPDVNQYLQPMQDLIAQIKNTYAPSAQENDLTGQYNTLNDSITQLDSSYATGNQNIADKTIPMEFITGQQQSLENRYLNNRNSLVNQATNINTKLNQAQTNRTNQRNSLLDTFQLENSLKTQQQALLNNITDSLKGIDPNKLTAAQTLQLSKLAEASGIPASLVMAKLSNAFQAEREALDQKMIASGYTPVASPDQLKGLTEQDILRIDGRIYAKSTDAKLDTAYKAAQVNSLSNNSNDFGIVGQDENGANVYGFINKASSTVTPANSAGAMRTDRNNNPTAMTTDVAKSLGLVEGVDYVQGDKFPGNSNLYTAKLLGDPIATTTKALDLAAQNPNKQAFYTQGGQQRWTYIGITDQKWLSLSPDEKKQVVASMYQQEGGNGSLVSGAPQTGTAAAWVDQINKGNAKLSDVPAKMKNQVISELSNTETPVSSLKQDALKSAKELLTKLDAGVGTSAVGGSRVFMLQKIPGTAPYNFEVQFNNLKSLLSLDNVKLLKGQGQVSDAERRLLSEASAKLDLGQSETEFKSALESIIKGLSGTSTGSGVDLSQFEQ